MSPSVMMARLARRAAAAVGRHAGAPQPTRPTGFQACPATAARCSPLTAAWACLAGVAGRCHRAGWLRTRGRWSQVRGQRGGLHGLRCRPEGGGQACCAPSMRLRIVASIICEIDDVQLLACSSAAREGQLALPARWGVGQAARAVTPSWHALPDMYACAASTEHDKR